MTYDRCHWLCTYILCYIIEIQTMKLEITFKGHFGSLARWHRSHRTTLGCSNHVSVLYRFWDIQRRIMAYPWMWVIVIENGTIDISCTTSCQSAIVSITLSILFSRYLTFKNIVTWLMSNLRGQLPCELVMHDLYRWNLLTWDYLLPLICVYLH